MTLQYRPYSLLILSTLMLVSCGPKKAEQAAETAPAQTQSVSASPQTAEEKKNDLIINEDAVMDVTPG